MANIVNSKSVFQIESRGVTYLCPRKLRLDVLETCFTPLLIRCDVFLTFVDSSRTKSATTVVKRDKISYEDQLLLVQVGQQY